MTRNYNDWTIKVEKIGEDQKEFLAEFYIGKTDGSKHFLQYYRYISERKTKPTEIIERVKKIIDALY